MSASWISVLAELHPALDAVLKMTAILAAGWALNLALRRRNPRWRVMLWRGVVVGVAVVPLIALLAPIIRISIPQPPPVQVVEKTPMAQLPDFAPPVETALPPMEFHAQPVTSQKPRLNLLSIARQHSLLLACALWAIIAVLCAVRALAAIRRVRRLIKTSEKAPPHAYQTLMNVTGVLGCSPDVQLLASAKAQTPFLCGLRAPRIILPRAMVTADYRDELPAILAHELAHLRTHDLWWMAAIQWLQCFLWWHPLFWRVNAAHAAACEEVSDAVAAQYVGDPASYSRTLARVALELNGRPALAAGLPMARLPEIRQRLNQLKGKIYASPLARRWVAVAVLCGLGCVLLIGGIKFVFAENTSPTQPNVTNQTLNKPTDETIEQIRREILVFEGPTPYFSEASAEEFLKKYGTTAVPVLMELLNENISLLVKGKVGFYLGKTSDDSTDGVVVDALIASIEKIKSNPIGDNEKIILRFTMDGLGFTRNREALAYLKKMVAPDAWEKDLRKSAIRGIAAAGTQEAEKILLSLKKRDGRDLSTDIDSWLTECRQRSALMKLRSEGANLARHGFTPNPSGPSAGIKGRQVHLIPSHATFEIPQSWLDAFARYHNNFHLTRSQIETAYEGAHEWDTEYAFIVNALFPHEQCSVHLGSEGWGREGGRYNDVQMRAYILNTTDEDIIKKVIENGPKLAAQLSHCRGKISAAQAKMDDWMRAKLSFELWFMDYGGKANVDVFAKPFANQTAILVFMYCDTRNQSEQIAGDIVKSFQWPPTENHSFSDNSTSGTRVIHFPKDESLGWQFGLIRPDPDSPKGEKWESKGQASGDMQVPAGVEAGLSIHNVVISPFQSAEVVLASHADSFSRLSTLGENDIQGLSTNVIELSNADVAAITHLKGLKRLYMSVGTVGGRKKDLIEKGALKNLQGLTKLEKLGICRKIPDEDLAFLQQLPHLRELNLTNSQISDEGLKYIGQVFALQRLVLNKTKITDTGLTNLKNLSLLGTLELNDTQISDAGLPQLMQMTSLHSTSLINTQITQQGIVNLKQALPKCQIYYARAGGGQLVSTTQPLPRERQVRLWFNDYVHGKGSSAQKAGNLNPNLSWNDIPVLLDAAENAELLKAEKIVNGKTVIESLPSGFASSYGQREARTGMIALWRIEGLRRREAKIPGAGPLNPFCIKGPAIESNDLRKSEGSEKIHQEVLAAYQKWWSQVAPLSPRDGAQLDPLSGTDLHWFGTATNSQNKTSNNGAADHVTSSSLEWKTKFDELYRLAEGENLKRIPPPFIPERAEYFNNYNESHNSKNRPPSEAQFFWEDELSLGLQRIGGGKDRQNPDPPSLDWVLNAILELKHYEFEGAPELLETAVPGDWIVRRESTPEQRIRALENILQTQLGKKITFEKQRVERDVFVASGKFDFKPLPEAPEKESNPNAIYLYSDADVLKTKQWFSNNGGSTVGDFLTFLGDRINIPIINESTSHETPSMRYLVYQKASQSYFFALHRLMENVTKQTSLQFTTGRRQVEIWFIRKDAV